MLTLKYRENVKIAFVTIALALMLFAEPVFAKKARSRSNKSSRSSQKTQQVKKASADPKVRQPSKVGKTPARVTSTPRSTKPRPKPGTSKPPSRISSRKTVTSSIDQSSGTSRNRRTIQRPKTTFNASKSIQKSLSASKPSGSPLGSKKLTRKSPGTRKPAAVSSNNRISSDKTSRIGSSIGSKKPSVTNRRVLSSDSKPNVHTSKTVANNNNKILGKSKSIVKQPEKKRQPSRERIGRIIKAERKAPPVTTEKLTRINKSNVAMANTTSSRSRIVGKQKSIVEQPRASKISRKHIGKVVKAGKKAPAATVEKPARDSKPSRGTVKPARQNSLKVPRKSEPIVKQPERQTRTSIRNHITKKQRTFRTDKSTNLRAPSLFTRPANERSQHIRPAGERSQHIRRERKKVMAESRATISRSREVISRRRKQPRGDGRSSRRRYREVSDVVREIRHHEHVYVDRHNRIYRRRIWPRDRFAIYYNCGPWWTFRYFYPYYHRRYVFVSLGGYWPVEYSYVRYYWYGCHPYTWYGYYPIAREVRGDTYNYYTYNYYPDDTTGYQPYQSTGDIAAVDHTTFADIRKRLAQQAGEEPGEETLADRYFDDAVKAFEAGDYETAAEMLANAMELAPEDIILPFAYLQALFANEQYAEATEALRVALAKVSPEKEGVFYPRGLYPEEDVLFEQIDQLAIKAELYSFDGDLQLLLGYHLLGIGEIEAAVQPLMLANQDLENASSAAVLLSLAEKMRIQNTYDVDE